MTTLEGIVAGTVASTLKKIVVPKSRSVFRRKRRFNCFGCCDPPPSDESEMYRSCEDNATRIVLSCCSNTWTSSRKDIHMQSFHTIQP